MLTRPGTMLRRLARAEVPPEPLAYARIGFGIAAILRAIDAIAVLTPLTDPELARFPWFETLPDPTTNLIVGILIVWFGSAVAYTLGVFTRAAGAMLSITIGCSILLDQQAYSNHLYLLALVVGLSVVSHPGAALSIDALRVEDRRTALPAWPIFLIKVQVTVVYVFAAVTKLNPVFLSGRLLNIQLGKGLVPVPDWLLVPGYLSLLSVFAVCGELLIAIFLWRSRGRHIAVLCGVGLHVSIAMLMAPTLQLIVFGLVMMSSYNLFLSDRRGVAEPELGAPAEPNEMQRALPFAA